ncbi:hypothetical protein DSM112329_03750 [Paraconexibacter sp. AEG42_29]|uniref:Lipoprotein n=1 Tax=Paraconexibacter sp. AEG42_29 TaxID=2997339 RepID=A0AAU7AZG4_9ACTN
MSASRTIRLAAMVCTVLVAAGAAGCGSETTVRRSTTTFVTSTAAATTLPAPRLTVTRSGWTAYADGWLSYGAYIDNASALDATEGTLELNLLAKDGTLLDREVVTAGTIRAHSDGRRVGGLVEFPAQLYRRIARVEMLAIAEHGVKAKHPPLNFRLVHRIFEADGNYDVYTGRLENTGRTALPAGSTMYMVYEDARGRIVGGDRGHTDAPLTAGRTAKLDWEGRVPPKTRTTLGTVDPAERAG